MGEASALDRMADGLQEQVHLPDLQGVSRCASLASDRDQLGSGMVNAEQLISDLQEWCRTYR